MFLGRSQSVAQLQKSQEDFQSLLQKLREQKMQVKDAKKAEDTQRVTEFRKSISPKRSISPEGHSPWKRSKVINEEFDSIKYENMGKTSGDVLR